MRSEQPVVTPLSANYLWSYQIRALFLPWFSPYLTEKWTGERGLWRQLTSPLSRTAMDEVWPQAMPFTLLICKQFVTFRGVGWFAVDPDHLATVVIAPSKYLHNRRRKKEREKSKGENSNTIIILHNNHHKTKINPLNESLQCANGPKCFTHRNPSNPHSKRWKMTLGRY